MPIAAPGPRLDTAPEPAVLQPRKPAQVAPHATGLSLIDMDYGRSSDKGKQRGIGGSVDFQGLGASR